MNRSLLPFGLLVIATAAIAAAAYFFIRPPTSDANADSGPPPPIGSRPAVVVKPLAVKLDELQAYLRGADPDLAEAMDVAVVRLREAGYGNRAPAVGDVLPDFELPAHDREKPLRLSTLTADGPVIVSWFRGTWCPFCRSELETLTELAAELGAAGARVIAVSPQLPEMARQAATEHGFTFPLLHDHDNQLARTLHLVYPIPSRILDTYRAQDLDLEKWNGVKTTEEPIPATFLVDRHRVIRYAYVNADFRTRMNTDELLAALRRIPRQ